MENIYKANVFELVEKTYLVETSKLQFKFNFNTNYWDFC